MLTLSPAAAAVMIMIGPKTSRGAAGPPRSYKTSAMMGANNPDDGDGGGEGKEGP